MMNNRSNGMTFIEVLIALFILATGILGAVAMQTTAKKGSFDAMQRSLASALAQDIIERIRSNSADNATLLLYQGDYGTNTASNLPANRCNTAGANCTTAEIAANDIYEWNELLRGAEAKINNKNAGGLAGAVGCLSVNGQEVQVIISWQGRTKTSDGGTGNCGSTSDNSSRRQLTMTAFVF